MYKIIEQLAIFIRKR